MRWQALFDDLAAQLAHHEALELSAEAAERSRAERAKVELVHRLLVHQGPLALSVSGVEVRGVVQDVAPQWLLLSVGVREVLIPTEAIDHVEGLTRQVAPGVGQVLRRLGLGHALRALARDRCGVQVTLRSGGVLSGTVDRVGADHFDLARHQPGEWRRASSVNSVATVPFTQIATVSRAMPAGG